LSHARERRRAKRSGGKESGEEVSVQQHKLAQAKKDITRNSSLWLKTEMQF